MAKIIYQPWIQERFNDAGADALETLKRQIAILLVETQRRCLVVEGEDSVRQDESVTDEQIEFLRKVNNGKEPPRIHEIRPDRSERNMLKELGAGESAEGRKIIRLKFEMDVLMNEAERLIEQKNKLEAARSPNYSKKREKAIRSLLAELKLGGIDNEAELKLGGIDNEDNFLEFLEWAMFTPDQWHGAVVHRVDDYEVQDGEAQVTLDTAPYVLDLHHAVWHLWGSEARVESPKTPAEVTTRCGQQVLDMGANQNTRIVQTLHLASLVKGEETICAECLPDLAEAPRIDMGKYGLKVREEEMSPSLSS